MSATVELRLANVTLKELQDELGKLCFAGYGDSTVDFKTSGTGWSNIVYAKVFKPGSSG